MEVLDLVKSAAIKSGVVSSFSMDDMPGDVIDMGVEVISAQILPQLNCDRTIDITTTCRTYVPVNGVIELIPLRQPIENFILLGYSVYDAKDLQLIPNGHWRDEIDRLYEPGSDNWPQDDFGEQLTLAVWSKDMKLVYSQYVTECHIGSANIDFMPMRVESVIDAGTRLKYTYLYRDEFEQTVGINCDLPGVYAVEEYSDRLIIILRGSNAPKKLILPVPLTIVNQSHDRPGTIIAPPKFEKYLIDATAYQLAVVYGMATKPDMAAEMSASYNLLKKNHTEPLHAMNVPQHINKLIHHRGRRYYENI